MTGVCALAVLHRAHLIRVVEEELLALFAAGRVAGTTHTCIGQELSAVSLAASLDRDQDTIVSNHRCHGHYLAWSDDVDGLVAEVMGKGTGVCAGVGGSQHLHARGFYSNGIQGGGMPVAAGLAFAMRLADKPGIVAACIGDGTLGEGTVYETCNIAAKWRLPLLIVLENNRYAQSTAQAETLAGDIDARFAAFGIACFAGDTWRHEELAATLRTAVKAVRAGGPAFVRVDTYRLAAHSKGDDDRDPAEIAAHSARDPVKLFLADPARAGDPVVALVRERVARAIELASAGTPRASIRPSVSPLAGAQIRPLREPASAAATTQLEAIRAALHATLADDPRVLLLGEDIRSPYGGAFKATRGLSDAFPARVLNTPISEASIVGVGTGLALGGWRPIVEIMFGDFLTLCMDQLVNHAAKFPGMYAGVAAPLVVRTPMGGGRGYGPTHSQNLEKHFVGVPGLTVLVLHARARIDELYRALRLLTTPCLVVENKLLYRERCDSPLPSGFVERLSEGAFPTTVLTPPAPADITIVAFGRMGLLAEAAAARLAREEEIAVELVFPLQVSPFDVAHVLDSALCTGRLLVVEEGAAQFDLGSEVLASVAQALPRGRHVSMRRVGAAATVIPSAPALEKDVLPCEEEIVAACLGLFDE